MREGMEVERLSRAVLPPGHMVGTREIRTADRQTREAISSGERVLYQPTALAETGVVARADVLIRLDHGWHLIEVNPHASISPMLPSRRWPSARPASTSSNHHSCC